MTTREVPFSVAGARSPRETGEVPEDPQRFVLTKFGGSLAALDALRTGADIEVDLVSMSDTDRRRVIDLVSGAAYGLDVKVERIAKHVFRLTRAVRPGGQLGGVREPRRPNRPSASGAIAVEVPRAIR